MPYFGTTVQTERDGARFFLRVATLLPVQAKIQRHGRMRQGPHADPFDPRFRHRADCPQVDAAGGLKLNRRSGIATGYGLAQRGGIHIVQQDQVGPRRQDLIELLQGVDLDFHDHLPARVAPSLAKELPRLEHGLRRRVARPQPGAASRRPRLDGCL